MIVCQIAKDQLDEVTIRKVEEVLAYFESDFPESSTFLTASCFADDLTSLGVTGLRVWHGVRKVYSADDFLTQGEIERIEAIDNVTNLLTGICQCVEGLKKPNARKWEKSFLLRCLLHSVADIHQPLHAIQLYSPQFPLGDLGGHRFLLKGIPYKNLHILWDAAFGFGPSNITRPLSSTDEKRIREAADLIEKMFPKDSLPECNIKEYTQWSEESYQIAIHTAYEGVEPGEIPSPEYLEEGRRVALRQLALAGYRLSMLLNEIFH